jgi:D-alanyl-D-alanine carboxypeptidase/D-alanyl-D-alanine-endopeptidase (penicillin-binding protein 4)
MRQQFLKILSLSWFTISVLSAQTTLQSYLNGLTSKTGLETALIGICVKQADGTKIASVNEDMLLSPASCQKLVTTSTALLMLGPDFQFKTYLQYDGSYDGNSGTLKGNIYLRGGGDPTLGSEKFASTVMDSLLSQLITKVKTLGVKKIEGQIIGDDEIFESIMAPGTWDWGDLGQYYGAGPCGLTICDNMVCYYLKSGSESSPTQYVRMKPYIPNVTIINEVKSGANNSGDDSFIFGSEYSYYRHIVGKVSGNESEFKVKGSIPDPAWYAVYVLDSVLKSNGVEITKAPTTTRILREANISYSANENRTKITTIYSPVLKNIIKQINVHSNNLYAEQLHKYIAYQQQGFGSNLSANELVKNFWINKGIPANEIIPVDGSGLSRSNAITASALTDLLIKMKGEKYFEEFYGSLPVSGKNGTMSSFGKGTILENNLTAKSGSMTRVRSYAGYVKSKNGKDLVFTILFNNYTCKNSEIRKICEEVIVKMAELN